MEIEVLEFTKSQLEEHSDIVKIVVLESLVAEKMLTEKEADQWAKTHTILLRKKSFFRTITDLWSKEKEIDERECIFVVKKVK